jgi:hypothetical protein
VKRRINQLFTTPSATTTLPKEKRFKKPSKKQPVASREATAMTDWMPTQMKPFKNQWKEKKHRRRNKNGETRLKEERKNIKICNRRSMRLVLSLLLLFRKSSMNRSILIIKSHF